MRALAPLGDGLAESPGESALRLHWHDAGLPWPRLQIWIYADDGTPLFRIDIGDPDSRYGAEYDGEEHHTEEEDQEHDLTRREWIADHRFWKIDPFTKHDVYRPGAWPVPRLQSGHQEARRNMSLWTPGRRDS